MYKRPDVITIVGVLLLVLGAYSVLLTYFTLGSADSLIQFGHTDDVVNLWVTLAASFCYFLCGIYILGGQNWSRWLFLALTVAMVIYDLIMRPDRIYILVPDYVLRAVFIVCLFLPASNSYFRTRSRR